MGQYVQDNAWCCHPLEEPWLLVERDREEARAGTRELRTWSSGANIHPSHSSFGDKARERFHSLACPWRGPKQESRIRWDYTVTCFATMLGTVYLIDLIDPMCISRKKTDHILENAQMMCMARRIINWKPSRVSCFWPCLSQENSQDLDVGKGGTRANVLPQSLTSTKWSASTNQNLKCKLYVVTELI